MTTNSATESDPYLKISKDRKRFRLLGRLREVVFGAQDGIISTVTITAAVALAGATFPVIFIAGLTTAIAGMVSMGFGAYLGSQTEKHVEEAELERETREYNKDPEAKLNELIELAKEHDAYTEPTLPVLATAKGTRRKQIVDFILTKKLGIIDSISPEPVKDAIVMAVSFLVASFIPLMPYILLGVSNPIIGLSIGLALLSLLSLGILKGKLIKRSPMIQGGIVLAIGTVSALMAYTLGHFIPKLFGVG